MPEPQYYKKLHCICLCEVVSFCNRRNKKFSVAIMDDILSRRVQLRKAALDAAYDAAKSAYNTGVDASEGSRLVKQLKGLVAALDRELLGYQSKAVTPAVEVVEAALNTQINAEGLCSDMEHSLSEALAVEQRTSQIGDIPSSSTARLPKLELPKFNGDKLNGLNFGTGLRLTYMTRILLQLTNFHTYWDA